MGGKNHSISFVNLEMDYTDNASNNAEDESESSDFISAAGMHS
jgi:hypothetical protein